MSARKPSETCSEPSGGFFSKLPCEKPVGRIPTNLYSVPMPAPRMKEIAEVAGVSIMTVSLALRNHPSLPVATRKKVMAKAKELGYRPNPMVSALMSQIRRGRGATSHPVIAYINFFSHEKDWKSNQVHRELFQGANRRCNELGFRLEEFPAGRGGQEAGSLDRIFYTRNIQGVILGPLHPLSVGFSLNWNRLSCAALGYSLQQPMLHRAVNHQNHAMRMVLEKLGKLGCRRLGIVMDHEANRRVDYNWSAGRQAFCDRYGKDYELPLFWTDEDFSNRAELGRWIRRSKPDGLVSISPGILLVIRELGFNAPRDFALAVCSWSSSRPEVAGVDQNSGTVGAAGVDLVVEQLHYNERGVPKQPKTVLIEGRWRAGRTMRRAKRKQRGKAAQAA